MTNYTVAYSKSGIPVRLAEGIVSGSVGTCSSGGWENKVA